MRYRFRKKISYFFNARHRKGHGIHSPFLFRLITQVIENRGFYSAYSLLKSADENVRNMVRILDVKAFLGEGNPGKGLKNSDFKRLHLLPSRFDRLLFRLVNDFTPREIAFYGSTFGVTLLALALADRRISLNARVENDHFRSFCRRLIEVYEVGNIRLTEFGEIGTADFVVIQNPLDPESCNQVLTTVLGQTGYQGVVVICGIHTSAAMEDIWVDHKSNPTVRVSLDLFEIGIFICLQGLQKEEFVLRF